MSHRFSVEADTLSVSDAYCSKYISKPINNPQKDKDWDGTEFFDI